MEVALPESFKWTVTALIKTGFDGLLVWYRDGVGPQIHDTLRLCDGLSTAAQFIRNVTPLAGRPSRHAAQAPSMPVALLPRTTLPPRSASWDRQAGRQTEKSSGHATKQSPAPLPRVPRSQSIEIPRRRLGSECPFVQHQPRCELPAHVAARPLKAKVRRKFRPTSARSPQPKTQRATAWRTFATPANHRESVPKSSGFRWQRLDRRHATRVPPQPEPRVGPPPCGSRDVSKTPSPATTTDKSRATPPASNRPFGHSRPRQRFP